MNVVFYTFFQVKTPSFIVPSAAASKYITASALAFGFKTNHKIILVPSLIRLSGDIHTNP